MRAFRKDVVYWGKVIVLGVILGVGIQFARAWTEPTLPPPGGNVAGPLTTGAVDQVKSAGLGLVGNLVVGAIGSLQSICLNGDCRTAWPKEIPEGGSYGYCQNNWGGHQCKSAGIPPITCTPGGCACPSGYTLELTGTCDFGDCIQNTPWNTDKTELYFYSCFKD